MRSFDVRSSLVPSGRLLLGVPLALLLVTCGQQARQLKLGDVTFNDHGTVSVQGKSELELEADSYYFKPTFLQGIPGQVLKLEIENESTAQHSFTITSIQVDKDIPPKGKVEVTVTFPQSGVLNFFCKYHAAQGMNGELLAGTATPQAVSREQQPPRSRYGY